MGEQLAVAGRKVPLHEALDVVLGYAFASKRGQWKMPKNGVGDSLPSPTVPRWAYRAYDCIPADPSPGLQGIDLFVADGIDAQMRGRTLASMLSVVREVSAQLEALDQMRVPFWELDRHEVAEQPARDDRAWPIWRAWTVLESVKYCGVAVTHKTLHHKRPDLFPLLDRKTVERLGPRGGWGRIHDDLVATPDAWAELEEQFAAEARRRDGVRLTRLRLHDILVWTDTTGAWDAARGTGQELLTPLRTAAAK